MMLSAHDDWENISLSFDFNCDQFVSKPVSEMHIRSVMKAMSFIDGDPADVV